MAETADETNAAKTEETEESVTKTEANDVKANGEVS